MKFVYVIVSSEKDYYIEEALVSMYSLKIYNPNAKITAIMDKETFDSLKEGRERIKTYIDEVIIPEIPDGLTATQKSRYLKTSLRPLVKGDFLYIDNDTVIKGDLSELEKFEFDVGAVLNQHRDDWSVENPHPMIISYLWKAKKNIKKEFNITKLYNGGIILVRDTEPATVFFQKWHELWLKDMTEINFYKDQPSMWRANHCCGNIIKPLPGEYNFQAVYPLYSLPYFENCKIFHYFSSVKTAQFLKMKDMSTLLRIRKEGIKDKMKIYLSNINEEYRKGLKVIMDDDIKFFDTPTYILGKKIERDFPLSNKIAKSIYRLFGHKI